MTKPFAGQTVLVTGASRGIGAVTAALLVQQGARVIRMSRSAMPPMAHSIDIPVDLADPHARAAAFAMVSEQHGTPDAIVSNAGAFLLAPLAETSDDLMREQIAINLEAPRRLAGTRQPLQSFPEFRPPVEFLPRGHRPWFLPGRPTRLRGTRSTRMRTRVSPGATRCSGRPTSPRQSSSSCRGRPMCR